MKARNVVVILVLALAAYFVLIGYRGIYLLGGRGLNYSYRHIGEHGAVLIRDSTCDLTCLGSGRYADGHRQKG